MTTETDRELLEMAAEWDCESRKSDTYKLINMIHAMAGSLAVANKDRWCLSKTATYTDHVLTVWTNGIVEVGAETDRNINGESYRHKYWIKPVTEEGDE